MSQESKVEFRKLQVTGGSTYIVSLPKNWIKANNLNPSDIVSVEQLPLGSPDHASRSKRNEAYGNHRSRKIPYELAV